MVVGTSGQDLEPHPNVIGTKSAKSSGNVVCQPYYLLGCGAQPTRQKTSIIPNSSSRFLVNALH